jgi:adenine-specific DNA-methyltransferase
MHHQHDQSAPEIEYLPATEGIKYAGSKRTLLPAILQLVRTTGACSVLDGFSGTTRVSQALAKSGLTVFCNDIAVWSEVFATCYLQASGHPHDYQGLIDHLNAVQPVDGWFTEHYGGDPNNGLSVQADGRKKPWQRHNTRKLDAIRQEIDRLGLAAEAKAVALTSLILALDRVDNTIGHYAAYLQKWSARSYRQLQLTVPAFCPPGAHHQIFRRDIFDVVGGIDADLAYFDPPYGSNNAKMPPSRVRYAAYYHPWSTICLNDQPEVFGRVHRRADSADAVAASVFEDFRRDEDGRFVAVRAIDRLLAATRCRWVLLSYSSGGRATAEELHQVICRHGRLQQVMEIAYRKNVMAGMKWTNQWLRDAEQPHREFMFLLDKGSSR